MNADRSSGVADLVGERAVTPVALGVAESEVVEAEHADALAGQLLADAARRGRVLAEGEAVGEDAPTPDGALADGRSGRRAVVRSYSRTTPARPRGTSWQIVASIGMVDPQMTNGTGGISARASTRSSRRPCIKGLQGLALKPRLNRYAADPMTQSGRAALLVTTRSDELAETISPAWPRCREGGLLSSTSARTSWLVFAAASSSSRAASAFSSLMAWSCCSTGTPATSW